jgi:hypothetical protein
LNLLPAMLATLLWGGIVAADTAAFLQLLLSQPFVAGTVTGALWGRLALGCEMGAILQLFALGTLPLGGRTPEDFPVGAVVGVAVAAILDRTFPIASAQGGPILYGLGVAFLVALAGKPVLAWQRAAQRTARALGRARTRGRSPQGARACAVGGRRAGVRDRRRVDGDRARSRVACGPAAVPAPGRRVRARVAPGLSARLGVRRGTRDARHVARQASRLLFWIMLVAFLAVRLLGQS